MSDRSWMDADTRAEFRQNQSQLIEVAQSRYGINLEPVPSGDLYVGGVPLGRLVEFYQDYRSEIEEML